MATTTKTKKNATTNPETVKCPQQDIHSVIAMRAALINAHNTGNKRAINADDCMDANIPTMKLDQWKDWTNRLRLIIADYVVAKSVKDHDPKEVKKLRNRIFPEWRKILKVGEEDKLHKTMFVSEFDVDSLVGLCETWISTARGSAWSVQSATMFRKGVEAYLGCRIAANAVLTDEDRDTIRNYENAQKAIKNANDVLHGTTDAQGKHVDGILDELAKASKKIVVLEKQIAQFTSFSSDTQGDLATFMQEQIKLAKASKEETVNQRTTLEASKAKAEKTIKKANATIQETAEKYAIAIAKIKEIEA